MFTFLSRALTVWLGLAITLPQFLTYAQWLLLWFGLVVGIRLMIAPLRDRHR